MLAVVLTVHLLLAVSLIGVVLLQKSEGGALGMGGGGMSGFMTGRSTANLLTRTTAVLAALFFATSIALAVLAARQRASHSVIDLPAQTAPTPAKPAPAPSPAKPAQAPSPAEPGQAPPIHIQLPPNLPGAPAAPAAPAGPAEPNAPLAK
ncbi:MAG TPA: preprotein translocase subunit SecG [Stellaceae bacterium]|nr:preprotein translocase subunit SecG [Stellaceae bacterium]